MGIDEIFDLNIEITENDLDALDAQAAQAEKRFSRVLKEKAKLQDKFIAADEQGVKIQAAVQKKLDRIEDKIEKKQLKEERRQDKEEERERKKLQDILDKAELKQQRLGEKESADTAREIQKILDKAELRQQRQDEKIEKKISRIVKRDEYKAVAGTGDNKTFLQNVFGGGISSSPKVALSFFQSPLNFIYSTLQFIPMLGGVLAAKEIADFIWQELVRIDDFFKKFHDVADDRVNVFLNRHDEANIRGGLSQRISVTQTGSIDPRDSYNSYEEFYSDNESLENRYATRTTGGI